MESNDCITKDCSTIYRFQFASIAFLCSVYLPFTFHSNIWLLYTQPFTPVNCSMINPSFISGSTSNMQTKTLLSVLIKDYNQPECCPCNGIFDGSITDKNLLTLCQEWMTNISELKIRKATIIDEWHLACGQENRKNLMTGSISFLIAEIIGVITVGILADHYGRKLMLLMCLYIPVLFGSLAAFTTTYSLFIILRWPVGFLNKGLLLLVYIMVIESCEYKHRAQIGCLLLASIPIFGIIIGVTYFFLLDWRHMQLLGTLITTLTLCYPWLIPESRRWYVNSHRVSRVNKLLQLCSNKQTSTLGFNKVGSLAPSTIIYDKPVLSQDALSAQTCSLAGLFINRQLRTITFCLSILWFLSSFCYRCTSFPSIFPHPTMNYVLMNATEFFSFIIAFLVAYKIGRRAPVAVLILISGLSSVSFAITLLGTGHIWLEITFSLVARGCLRICYCLLILFTTELYPTSVRATGLAIGLSSEVIARILVELLLYYAIDRILLLFISGGMLCLSCCLICPLPETILYDLPDSLTDLQSMKRSIGNDNNGEISPHNPQCHMIDSNTLAFPRLSQSNMEQSNLNDLFSLSPKTILKTQQQEGNSVEKTVTIHSQPEVIQINSYRSSLNGLSNPCYFTSLNDTIDQYEFEQQIDSGLMFSIQGTQNNNNNNNTEEEIENTRF
ncbi:unnamed protein product [Adineta steineri]|uniref:Major facilitator superfamily (MFS) profile domain-containing protein n=1 Tax=Adineta steineri TaxID=433720 RepID=A0A814KD19_9BILA|nr:unnamed protein product [Adineta steineri]CAF3843725.1 unnamed protein product [Adineta steineri]